MKATNSSLVFSILRLKKQWLLFIKTATTALLMGGGGANIAQWICLHLSSGHPGFEFHAHHLHCYQFKLVLCRVDINKKEAGIGPVYLKTALYVWQLNFRSTKIEMQKDIGQVTFNMEWSDIESG